MENDYWKYISRFAFKIEFSEWQDCQRCYFSYAILGVVWRMPFPGRIIIPSPRIESLQYKIGREGRIYKSEMRSCI